MTILDTNTSFAVVRTLVTNTDIVGVPANTAVIAAGPLANSTSFANVPSITIDYSHQIEAIAENVLLIQEKLDALAANVASITYMAANVGIKVMEGYSWLQAASQARFGLPYTLASFNKQANNDPSYVFPYPDEAYTLYNNSSANLVALRDLASTIPPYTTNTGGATMLALVFVGPTEPIGAVPNTLWWNTADGEMYIRYDDGDSIQWVAA